MNSVTDSSEIIRKFTNFNHPFRTDSFFLLLLLIYTKRYTNPPKRITSISSAKMSKTALIDVSISDAHDRLMEMAATVAAL